jgi:hypothetical protein
MRSVGRRTPTTPGSEHVAPRTAWFATSATAVAETSPQDRPPPLDFRSDSLAKACQLLRSGAVWSTCVLLPLPTTARSSPVTVEQMMEGDDAFARLMCRFRSSLRSEHRGSQAIRSRWRRACRDVSPRQAGCPRHNPESSSDRHRAPRAVTLSAVAGMPEGLRDFLGSVLGLRSE